MQYNEYTPVDALPPPTLKKNKGDFLNAELGRRREFRWREEGSKAFAELNSCKKEIMKAIYKILITDN